MTTSNDPNKTSGRVQNAVISLSYPLNEVVSTSVRLRFVKYTRDEPSHGATLDTTAIITLPMPFSIPDNSSFAIPSLDLGRWGNINTGGLNNTSGAWNTITEAVDQGVGALTKEIQGMRTANKTSGLRALALSPMAGKIPTIDANGVRHFAGITENPHTTIAFEGVNLKSFTFSWRLSPRSNEEAEVVRRIVERIKIQTHPEEALRGIALDYPDLVYVDFTGTPQDYLPKFHRSIVTNIMFNPSTGTGPTFYKSGAPTESELTVSFQEVRIVTRNLLREDFGVTQ